MDKSWLHVAMKEERPKISVPWTEVSWALLQVQRKAGVMGLGRQRVGQVVYYLQVNGVLSPEYLTECTG